MEFSPDALKYIIGFAIVTIASLQIAKVLTRLKLPLITGFLFTGILAGPFVLLLLKKEGVPKLDFLNDFSLAFIAFAAGSELFLKDLAGRYKSIFWNTIGQLFITFLLGGLAIMAIADYIPFLKDADMSTRLAVAMLSGTIFVASSPASAIAIINEMKAKGPFVSTSLGVTVFKDVWVIILFTIVFSLSQVLIHEDQVFELTFLLVLLLELALSVILGYVVGRLIQLVLRMALPFGLAVTNILILGFSVYLFSDFLHHYAVEHWNFELHLEPLLICIIGSFWVTNYTDHRQLWHKIMDKTGPYVYVTFFTLTGASMSLDVLAEVWVVALILFGVRLGSMVIAGYVGAALAGDRREYRAINWMPYVTQAGVGLGLAIIVSEAYPDWGPKFATIIIGVIVLNQVIGPPLFKWAIHRAGEDHVPLATPEFDGVRDAMIYGLDTRSVALAKLLMHHGWVVKVITHKKDISQYDTSDIDIRQIDVITAEILIALDSDQAEAVMAMASDDNNLIFCELATEFLGTKDMIVLLNDASRYNEFKKLGAMVVHPSTAIVSLLDHMVRSPQATQLLLGMEEGKDSMEIEVQDESIDGLLLRDVKLPEDIIVLSIRRGQQLVIPHGYTRLRLRDYVTVVGPVESLEVVALRLRHGGAKSSPNPFAGGDLPRNF